MNFSNSLLQAYLLHVTVVSLILRQHTKIYAQCWFLVFPHLSVIDIRKMVQDDTKPHDFKSTTRYPTVVQLFVIFAINEVTA